MISHFWEFGTGSIFIGIVVLLLGLPLSFALYVAFAWIDELIEWIKDHESD